MEQPGWLTVGLGAACGLLLGVVLALALTAGDDGDVRTTTVTVARTSTTGGTTIVSTRVPDVAGQRLDVAEDRLRRARFEVDVDGGGVLGVIREANWEVVAQSPAAGTLLEQGSSVTVEIERR